MKVFSANYLDFFTFLCYKETNYVSIQQMASTLFFFQPTQIGWLTILPSYIYISSSLNIKKLPEETTLKSLVLLGLKQIRQYFWKVIVRL